MMKMRQVPLLNVERATESGIIAHLGWGTTYLTRPDTGEHGYYELDTGYVSDEWVRQYIEWCDVDELVAKGDMERRSHLVRLALISLFGKDLAPRRDGAPNTRY